MGAVPRTGATLVAGWAAGASGGAAGVGTACTAELRGLGSTSWGKTMRQVPSTHPMTSGRRSGASLPLTTLLTISPRR
jgi:hypothetical protein